MPFRISRASILSKFINVESIKQSKTNLKWRAHILGMKNKHKNGSNCIYNAAFFYDEAERLLKFDTFIFGVFLDKNLVLKLHNWSFFMLENFLSFLVFSQVQVVVLSFVQERLSISSTTLWFDEKNQSQRLHNFASFRCIFLVKWGEMLLLKYKNPIWQHSPNVYILLTNSKTINPNFLIN